MPCLAYTLTMSKLGH